MDTQGDQDLANQLEQEERQRRVEADAHMALNLVQGSRLPRTSHPLHVPRQSDTTYQPGLPHLPTRSPPTNQVPPTRQGPDHQSIATDQSNPIPRQLYQPDLSELDLNDPDVIQILQYQNELWGL